MVVQNLNLKPAAESPQPRAPADLAETKRPAVERANRGSSRVDSPVEPGQKPSARPRLTYDDELSRVFIEIVDSDSGEVVSRFPPEQLVRHIDNLINEQLASESQRTTGFLVDRLV